MTELESQAAVFRALGSADRLRLLALCQPQPARVSDLAQCLGDSEPNVSRALKTLAAAGLLRRERVGQCVRYGLAEPDEPGGRVARQALQSITEGDATLRRARGRLARVAAPRPDDASRLGRALRAELSTQPGGPDLGRVLLAGMVPAEVASWALDAAAQVVRLNSGPIAPESIDLCIWGIEANRDAVAEIDACARRAAPWMLAQGRLCLHAPYDALDGAGASPPAHLRALMQQAGWDCQRIRPIEAGSHHLLVAHARRATPAPTTNNAFIPRTDR